MSLAERPVVVDVPAELAAAADWAAAAELAAERAEPESDIHATADYRRHLARVLAERALAEAAAA